MRKKLYTSSDQIVRVGHARSAQRDVLAFGVIMLVMGLMCYLTKDINSLSLLSRLIEASEQLITK